MRKKLNKRSAAGGEPRRRFCVRHYHETCVVCAWELSNERFTLVKCLAYSIDTRFVKNDEKVEDHETCFHATI